ncbi:hypothetical protein Tco_0919101 [Tanacetum coccineum]
MVMFFISSLGSRESLERDMDGTEEFLLSNLFDFWLTKVSTDRLKVDTGQQKSAPSPIPSPSIDVPDPEGSSGNHRGESSNDASLSGNEDGQEAKESSQTTYHTSQSLDEHKISKEDLSEEKGGYTRNPTFDDIDDFVDVDDTLDYMESEDAQDEGRISSVVLEEKENADKEVSTEAPVSTVKPNKGTNKKNEGTDNQNKEKLKEKEKGVEIRNIEDTERPRPTSTRSILTFRPLPKIDPKDKGKKRIEEEDEPDTKSKWTERFRGSGKLEAEKKRLDERRTATAALSNKYDFIQARFNADKILAEKLQEEEREMYTIEQRTKISLTPLPAQSRFLAQQDLKLSVKNKPPSRNQLRNQMMTYLKHVRGKKHFDLKTKSFDEIQVLYEKIKRFDDSFIAIGSAKDEKMIKEMN